LLYYRCPPDLLSFPTRRSSDLAAECCKRARGLLATFDCPPPSLVASVNYAEIRVCMLLGDLDKLFTLAQHNVDIAEEQHWRQHRSEEHTSELQSRSDLVCRLLL